MIKKVNIAHPYLVEKIHKRMWTKMTSLLERKNEMGNDYFGNLGALAPIIQAGLPIVMQLLQVNRHISGPSFRSWSSSLWREPWQVLPSNNNSSSRLLADLHISWLAGTLGALQSQGKINSIRPFLVAWFFVRLEVALTFSGWLGTPWRGVKGARLTIVAEPCFPSFANLTLSAMLGEMPSQTNQSNESN